MTKKDVVKTSIGNYRVPIIPIPTEFDYVPEDVYPLTGGGFECYMCGARTESTDLADLKHNGYCTGGDRKHGQVRAEYLRRKSVK